MRERRSRLRELTAQRQKCSDSRCQPWQPPRGCLDSHTENRPEPATPPLASCACGHDELHRQLPEPSVLTMPDRVEPSDASSIWATRRLTLPADEPTFRDKLLAAGLRPDILPENRPVSLPDLPPSAAGAHVGPLLLPRSAPNVDGDYPGSSESILPAADTGADDGPPLDWAITDSPPR